MDDLPRNSPEQDTPTANTQSKRRRGRPRGRTDPSIDWEPIERAYVYGDEVTKADFEGSGQTITDRHFPTVRELAARFNMSKSNVQYRVKRYGWQAKRDQYRKTFEQELTLAIAKARALSTADAVAILDSYIRQFADSIVEGRVRADAIADLNTAMRLKAFMQGEADSRSAVAHTVSLDALQAAHRNARPDEVPSDEIAGVLPPSGGRAQLAQVEEHDEGDADPFRGVPDATGNVAGMAGDTASVEAP